MPSVFRIEKKNIDNPQKWYEENWECALEEDAFSEIDDYYVFDDFSEEIFMFVPIEKWLSIAAENHLMYGWYSEDSLSAEYIEIKDGKCIREYREYRDMPEDNVNEGDEPQFENWVDVASYVDSNVF